MDVSNLSHAAHTPHRHRALKVILIILVIILAIVLGLIGYTYYRTGTNPLTTSPTTAAQNAVLQSVDVGSMVDSAVEENKTEIASALGVSEEQVDQAVTELDVSSWEIVDKPSGLTATGSFDTTYSGQAVTVTTYDDPSYVSANISGMDVTFAVPASAQSYVAALS